ncbi:CocE/NonD family hydrolase [Streptomyces tauricus]|uniref:CocE/NonD family hydrolase n=1 Tax=Streptomyces tauricus TaxID=68274 RepID=UPI00387F1539
MNIRYERTGSAPVPDHARQHRVRMRDGVRLATDVYLPPDISADADAGADADTGTGPQELPAVLVRLPYDKNSRYVYFDRIASLFTARGYALVVQDVRGKFRSGGQTLPFLREPLDGYDAIDWITHQPWSNGVVGMFGDSYYGFTQWAAVAAQHPALRAIVPRVTTVDFNGTTQSDPFDPSPVGRPVWLEGIEYYAHYWVDNTVYDFTPDRSVRPVIEQYEQAFTAMGARSAWFDLLAPRYTNLLPALGRHPFDARPVPVLHCVGWFDNISVPHMRDYLELASRPGWDAVQYLWAGAIDHENYHLDLAPAAPADDHAHDESALDRMLPGYAGPALDFFDVFLKGVRPVSSLPKVAWELGHDGWRTAEAWPPAGSTERTFWLTEPARARGPLPGGTLSDEPSDSNRDADGYGNGDGDGDGEQSVQWVYDPESLVPSQVANSFSFLQSYPDESRLAAREDVLVFTSPALAEPLDLAGPIGLALRVTSTGETFDLFAKVLDIGPDGQAHMIARGQVSVRSLPAPEEIPVALGHTGYRLRPGHRLALTLAGSDYPMFLPSSGSTENPWTTLAPKPSTQTLYADAVTRLTVTVLADPGATGSASATASGTPSV